MPSWSRVGDSDDVLQLWRLGRDAFLALGGFFGQADFDEAFQQHQDGIKVFAELLRDRGSQIDFRDEDGIPLKPDFSKAPSSLILGIFWQISNGQGDLGATLASHFLFSCLEEIDLALMGLAFGDNYLHAVIAAVQAFGNFQAISTGNGALQKVRSELAFHAAKERHARDPKQAEKNFVFECWKTWQQKPDSYRGKAAFARDMLNKCENLQSQKVIEDWCRDWEKSYKS